MCKKQEFTARASIAGQTTRELTRNTVEPLLFEHVRICSGNRGSISQPEI